MTKTIPLPARAVRAFRASAAATMLSASVALVVNTAEAATKIVHGAVFLSSTDWSEFVADAKGFFKERGLDVELITAGSSAKAVQELAAGSLNIASGGMPDHLRGVAQGAPIKLFANQIGTPPYTVYGRPEVKKVADLKGKKVIIGGPKDVTRYYIETLFAKEGLTPGQYDYLYAGATSNRFAALLSGGVDAAILLPPFTFKSESQGFTNLGNVQTVLSDFPFTVYSYNINWAKDHRQALAAYTAALLKATAWIYDKKNRDEAADILSKAVKSSKEDALANYDVYVVKLKAVSTGHDISEKSYRQMMEVLIGWGDMKAPIPPFSQFYDASIVVDAMKLLKK